MSLFRNWKDDGCKDDTMLWFIILFALLFFCGGCGSDAKANPCCD